MEDKRMSEQTPYEKLQVSEDASFEEIQAARDRLIAADKGEDKQREAIEAAYDAILMDRLRRRQEGKIKVPERIRFAERLSEEAAPKPTQSRLNQSPAWLQGLLDTPTAKDLLVPSITYLGLGGISLYASTPDALALLLALGVGFNLVWLNRKQQKLGRAFLITLAALIISALIGTAILQVTPAPLGLGSDKFICLLILLVFWIISCFAR
jgi:hypothetical protein